MVQSIVVFLLGAFALALIAEPVARLCRLPYTSVLVVLGIVAGQAVEFFGVRTGLDYIVLTDVVLKVLLPVLIYEAAQAMDLAVLRRYLIPVLLLVGPGFLIATLVTAALLVLAPGVDLPWLAVLILAALLSSTDPLAITSQLKNARCARAAEHRGRGRRYAERPARDCALHCGAHARAVGR
ncbi:MAG: hypothetical protein HC809_02580 [Gammaproteobacteria bacterium]|nr:hypothetical protein [Gammaproteobacteria bacterium]